MILIFKNIDHKKITIILSSIIFVEWKSFDNEHYREAYEIFSDLSQKEMKVNAELLTYGAELMYFIWVPLQDIDEFPILEKEVPMSKVTILAKQSLVWDKQAKQWIRDEGLDKKEEKYYIPEIDNLRDYFHVRVGEQKITHLLLDENNNTPLINDELRFHLKDIFNHENKYPFLVKVYDSRENGFNYYVKLFKIDYDLYNEWINES